MKQFKWVIYVAMAAGFLYAARNFRNDSSDIKPTSPTTPVVEKSALDNVIKVNIEYSRKGNFWPTQFKLISAKDDVLDVIHAEQGLVVLSKRSDVDHIVVEAQGHVSKTILWPDKKQLVLTLEPDLKILESSPKLPKTSEDKICALKVSQINTRHILPMVDVYLDGELVGNTGNTGVFISSQMALRKAKEIVFKKKGFKTKKMTLSQGKIDEFNVEGIYLEAE